MSTLGDPGGRLDREILIIIQAAITLIIINQSSGNIDYNRNRCQTKARFSIKNGTIELQ